MARTRIQDGRGCLTLFPRGYGLYKTWVYVFGLPGGVVKFGMTGKPRERAMQHWRSHGAQIQWMHCGRVFASSIEARTAEKTAFLLAVARGGTRVNETEMFVGLSREQAIACLRVAVEPRIAQIALALQG